MSPLFRRAPVLLACLVPSLIACNSILGIKDLSETDRPAEFDGDNTDFGGENSTASGGKASGSGGKASGSGGKASGSGGKASGSGGKASGSGGKASGSGGKASGGSGSGGDDAGESTGPVTGKVVDYFLRPVPGILVTIGSVSATTDSTGTFTIDDVDATYDLYFKVQPPGSNYAWMYVGLSRRDPTLQVYGAFESRSQMFHATASNLPSGPSVIDVAFNTPIQDTFDFETELTSWADFTATNDRIDTTLHALQWSGIDSADSIPSFKSTASTNLTFTGVAAEIALDSWSNIASAANVSGSIAAGSSGAPWFSMFVHFNDGAAIQVVDERINADPPVYSFPAPTVPETGITVAAYQYGDYGGLGITHTGGLTPGDAAPMLTVPDPGYPISPINNKQNVTAATQFQWAKGSSSPCSLIAVENSSYYEGVKIVTCASEASIPDVLGLAADSDFYWSVETHGSYKTMDELAGSSGMLDSFSNQQDAPTGLKRGTGSFAVSFNGYFTTAP